MCGTMQARAIFVQVDEAGPTLQGGPWAPTARCTRPYVGALVYDSYRAQTLISAPRACGDADFEMHDLKSMSAWHRHNPYTIDSYLPYPP